MFGERLKQAMKMRGVTAAELSRKTGISESRISHYLKGDYEAKQLAIYSFANELDISEAWLMGYDVPMFRTHIASNGKDYSKGVRINVLGRVAAGVPIEAQQEIIDWEEISVEMASTGQFFALQIHGDSMLPRIQDGDVVIVRQQPDIDSGDVAIVMVNGSDATCKRVAKYSDGIRLIPNNPSYEPVFYSNEEIESKPVKVIGKVVELRGKF